MPLQEINLGTYANDGTGDDLRTAFEKVKANFTDIYNSLNGANVGAVPPTVDVDQGELWWNTLDGRLYIKYSTAWVDASPENPTVFYDISAAATTGGANLELNGTDASIDAIKIASSTNITVTRTDANTITLSSTSYTGDVVGNLTGNVTGNVTGNADTVTNGVYTNGVYSDPVWLTSLAGNKISGNISGRAGSVTNGVYTSESYVNPSWLTSLEGSKVSGNISGNAGSVTNGVYTNASYANPGWITSIAGSKVSGNISGNAGTVTNGVYTNGSYADPTWLTSLAGSKVSGNISGNAGSVTNGVYTTSSVNALADVNTVSTPPTTGQALVWNGTNWVPGSVASGGGTLDFGTFTAPSGFTLDLGTF